MGAPNTETRTTWRGVAVMPGNGDGGANPGRYCTLISVGVTSAVIRCHEAGGAALASTPFRIELWASGWTTS